MLDTETKRRIDSARDILVGKVPDPKSQVEQITIALIYKFMDDMDAEAEEFGGKRAFFTGEFARYGWATLMRSGLGGHDMLALYSEAISTMPQNPGIPLLFRDIFKNAYLPYRDPETLRSFLKIIDEFSYDHSERLGDAFEYLLSVLGSQGDAGQFRTPRHIIDFMVEIMKPQKQEVVLDPACGTAGFLISAYKHILRNNTDKKGNSTLSPDEKAKLALNFKGYDISPDMVRLSLVNLYLHGFADPHIFEYDTLTSQDRWNEFADVILANPPFMSPKGGIKPHNRFSIQAKRSEVLFVDYMAEHLTPNGRAAIIVPEGIIFQSQTAYKELRKMLVENSLVAVISLPAGCFNPYSGVKTSILILDKSLAKTADSIAFFKVENDGFGLGAQRRAFDKNDLPHVQAELERYLNAVRKSEDLAALELMCGQVVPKAKIAANSDYNLSGERYRDTIVAAGQFPAKSLGELLKIQSGYPFKSDLFNQEAGFPVIRIRDIKPNRTVTKYTGEYDPTFIVQNGDLLIGMDGEFNSVIWSGGPALLNQRVSKLHSFTDCLKEYVALLIPKKLQEIEDATYAVTVKHISGKQIQAIEIPLPPLDVQKKIVAEIESYQKVINGARAVLDNYRPHISVKPEWQVVALGEVCAVNPRKSELNDMDENTVVSFVPMADLNENAIYFQANDMKKLADVTSSYTYFRNDDVLLAKVTPCFENGKAGIARNLENGIGFGSSEFYVLRSEELILPEWIYINVTAPAFRESAKAQMTGTGGLQRVPRAVVEGHQISLPPIEIQQAIVAEIEAEQALVAANKELIVRMEKKIQNVLARVWGEDMPPITEA